MGPNRLKRVCVELERMSAANCSRNRTKTNQILHARMTRLIDALHELQYVVGKAVNHGHANIIVILILPKCQLPPSPECRNQAHRIRVLRKLRRTRREDIRRVYFRIHRICLAGVNHKKHFVVSLTANANLSSDTGGNKLKTNRFFCHICSSASATSNALISSLSWNFRNSFPP